jgi:hypothetical protein
MRCTAYLILLGLIMFPQTSLAQESVPQVSLSQLPSQFSDFEKQLYIENEKLKMTSKAWWEDLLTPAVIGLFAGIWVTWWFNRKQIENRKWELIQSSFSWLAGGTQDRNIGIAVAEHFWNEESKYCETWLRLFTNQAVYLLADQFDRKAQDHKRQSHEVLQRLDEELSLQRLMAKLMDNKETIGKLQCDYLLHAIQKRLDDDKKYALPTADNRVTKDQLLAWRRGLTFPYRDFSKYRR